MRPKREGLLNNNSIKKKLKSQTPFQDAVMNLPGTESYLDGSFESSQEPVDDFPHYEYDQPGYNDIKLLQNTLD